MSRLIANAARDVLGTQGFLRKGRSRLWFADYRWWLILVEFQPSGWSRGSYLNVGAKWLWSPFSSWSFDFAFSPAARVNGFVEYQSEDQFRTASRELANTAAREALRLREAFPDTRLGEQQVSVSRRRRVIARSSSSRPK
jgi:hypothetical protein